MEENQVPNPEQFNVAGSGNGKKKKGLGPVKGFLLAILIVFLICVVGLLIRMVVAGDGDYFKPIKQLFGMEDEEEKEEKDTAKTDSKKSSSAKSSFQASGKYALLSDDVDGKDVKHYRLTVDMGEFFSTVMDELGTVSDSDFDYDYDENDVYGSADQLESMMGMAMMLLQEMGDLIDGEMYFDIYFEGNEIVQVVIGYDYAAFLENLYDYAKDEMEDEDISSVDDLADMMVAQFDEILDEDTLYDMIMDSSDEDIEASLKEFGIKEKDIKDAVDFNNDKGVIEIYINGTTKLKALISMALESEDFQEELKTMEDETGVKVDEDNIIESILEAANESEEYGDFGFEFVEVK